MFFEHRGIKAVAAKYGVTPAQVILSWAVQRNTVVIPKSENEQRLKQNITVGPWISTSPIILRNGSIAYPTCTRRFQDYQRDP